MTARRAHSLTVLLGQVNALFPHRSKASDGWIGDAAHAARVSDHNPDQYDIVRAQDFTHDPDGGLSGHWLADALVRSRDKRIRYIIWNHKIYEPGDGWSAYTGTNPHTKHLHLSVVHTVLADSHTEWDLGKEEDDMPNLDDLLNTKVGKTGSDELKAYKDKPGTFGHFLLNQSMDNDANRKMLAALCKKFGVTP